MTKFALTSDRGYSAVVFQISRTRAIDRWRTLEEVMHLIFAAERF